MAFRKAGLVFVLVIGAALGGQAITSVAQEGGGEETAIKTVLTDYAAAVARSDIEGMANYLDTSDDFSVIEGGHANWGWADYLDNHLVPEFTSPDFSILDYAIDEIRVHPGETLAYAVYSYRIAAEVKGERRERTAFATAVLVKTDDGWKIRHLHS